MQSALQTIGLICAINQIPFDPKSIINKFALTKNEPSIEEFVRILKTCEFKTKIKTLSLENLTKYEAPFVLQDKNGLYFTVLKVIKKDNESNNKSVNSKSSNNNNSTKKNSKNNNSYSFIVFNGGSSTNELTYDELINISNSKFIVLSHKMLNSKIKFGFGWFYKRMLNYKRIVFKVLIASFIMQLFGLVTPLFTQVVLDKVLTHHSISTLRVIAIAFLATIIFELLLSLSRNYIFAHTTTKIDAKLGSELFSHLALLPMTYFENRKVGNIVARVRELDSIRDFIANKSVTVILDLLFSFVFVLMMLLYSVKLTLIAIFFVTIIALIYFFITPILRKRLEDKFQMGAASNSYLVEAVTGMQTVKSLAIEGSMQREWENYLGNYVKSSFNLSNLSNVASGFADFINFILWSRRSNKRKFKRRTTNSFSDVCRTV